VILAVAVISVTALTGMPSVFRALDMDAFANAQIEADKKGCNPKIDPKCAPKMTEAAALCKYGNARAEACKKFKQEGGELPNATKEKSLGGAYAI
jgi:rhodanese-related sulfurtransferase